MRFFYHHLFPKAVLFCCFILFVRTTTATVETITVGGTSFVPASGVTINLGDTILWQWTDGAHTTTSTSVPAGAVPWDAPLNNNNTTFMYVPAAAGLYTYKCTPHEAMGMTGAFTVVCTPPGIPVISPAGSVSGCAGDSATLLTVTTEAGNEIQWKLNGNPVNGANAGTLFPEVSGTYTCAVSNSCGAEESLPVMADIEPSPEPAFAFEAAGLTVTFNNLTTDTALLWNWDFGDGFTSEDAEPVHAYSAAGSYTVSLTATDTADNGCSRTIAQEIMLQTSDIADVGKIGPALQIIPNPATGWMKIRVAEANISYSIYDIAGKLFLSLRDIPTQEGEVLVDIRTLPPGVYILEVRAQEHYFTRKLAVR